MNFCAAILILKMVDTHFGDIISRKVKMQLKHTQKIVKCMEKGLWLIEPVESGLQSLLVLLKFWPNKSLLWGCITHWKMFSSTPGIYPLEAYSSQHSQNIQMNKVIGENEKCVFYFMEKTTDFWANPI